jgi:putative restriction endonuclease
VVSGGYEDDEDFGDELLYTGHGGNDAETHKQVADQELTRQNLALAVSCDRGLPVRVVRGAGGDPTHSPASGYRYDGLFYIEMYWRE